MINFKAGLMSGGRSTCLGHSRSGPGLPRSRKLAAVDNAYLADGVVAVAV